MSDLTKLLQKDQWPDEGTMGRDLGWYPVASLPVPSGQLWIGDPWFSWADLRAGTGFRAQVEPGRYDVSAFVMAFGPGNFVARLRVCRRDEESVEFGRELGVVGTDSNCIGVGDASELWAAFESRFGDADDQPVTFLESFEFARCGLLQPHGPKRAALVYVHSGFGGESGPARELTADSHCVGFELPFIERGATG